MNEFDVVKERVISLIKSRCIREIVEGDVNSTEPWLDMLVKDNDGTFYWQDIDYKDIHRGEWEPTKHYTRILLSLCFGGIERLDESDYREKILGAVRFWLKNNFINSNWWHNEIGTPMHFADIALVLWNYFTDDDKEKMLSVIGMGVAKITPHMATMTGTNLIWGMQIEVRYALLTDDEDMLKRASRLVGETTDFAEEGIQPDGGFCMHGPRWYSGGYGASFTYDVAQLVYLLDGTSYQLTNEQISKFLLHVLDGQRLMMFKGYFDYNGVGRELSRPNGIVKRNIAYGVHLLAQMKVLPRLDEIKQFDEECQKHLALFEATRYYPSISYLCHRKNGLYFGIKCHNAKQWDAEQCNSEGVLCYNMTYGTRTCFMESGKEYKDIAPFWDYAHIPATTARLESDDELINRTKWWELPLPNDKTKGIARGDIGILREDAEHDGIKVKTAYFAFDGCLVALGADIFDEKNEGSITTTVEQSFSDSFEVISEGSCYANSAFRYTNLEDTVLIVKNSAVEGSWHRNSREMKDEKLVGEIFLAYIPYTSDHGTYAYCVSARDKSAAVEVVKNDGVCQAIAVKCENEGYLLVASRESSAVEYKGKTYRFGDEVAICKI